MSTSGKALNPRPFRVKQHDIDVFYALVGGAKNAAQSREETPVDATAGPVPPQSAPGAPASPVRRPPAPAAAAPADVAAAPDEQPVTGSGPADWAAALHGIAPAPRPVSRTKAMPVRRRQPSWSAKVLCKHLIDRVDQLHVDSWVRKVSGDAMRRLSRAQARLSATRPKHP